MFIMLAVLPGLLLLCWLYTRDKLHPEPKKSVYRLFLLGAAIVLPAGLLERAMLDYSIPSSQTTLVTTFVTAFFVAGMIEEFLKAAIVERQALRRGLFRTPVDCIVYCGAVSLGFATVENILYVTSSGFSTALLRSVTAVPAHFMFGILMGSQFARHVFSGRNKAFAYILPALAHGAYDCFALSAAWWSDILLVLYLVVLVEVALRLIERASRNTLGSQAMT